MTVVINTHYFPERHFHLVFKVEVDCVLFEIRVEVLYIYIYIYIYIYVIWMKLSH